MKSPANVNTAFYQLHQLMGERLKGSQKTRSNHRRRLKALINAIYRRTQRGPMQIKTTDLRRELDRALREKGQADAVELFTSVYQLACLRDKQDNWLPFLYGPWCARPEKGALPNCLKKERAPSASF